MNGGLDNFLKVRLRELQYDIKRIEGFIVLRFDDIKELDDVLMLQLLENCDFSQNPFAVNLIFKNSIHFLDCYLLAGRLVDSTGDCSVRTLS